MLQGRRCSWGDKCWYSHVLNEPPSTLAPAAPVELAVAFQTVVEAFSVAVSGAPDFSPAAVGRPKDWNGEAEILYWGRKALWRFPDAGPRTADMSVIRHFLQKRPGADGRPVLEKLGPSTPMGEGWSRFALMAFDDEAERETEAECWERAWHGCKFEALYSILYHSRLVESRDRGRGERLLDGAPGVYVHKDSTSHKAENYVRFVPLCGDGIFWGAKWEVRVDRADRVQVPRKTDQWVQRARSVRLAALWVCGRSSAEMRNGDAVSPVWLPELEANPTSEELLSRLEADDQIIEDDRLHEWSREASRVQEVDPFGCDVDDKQVWGRATLQKARWQEEEVAELERVAKVAAQVTYLERRQDDSWEGFFCLLCQKWANEMHLESKRHRVRAECPEEYLQAAWEAESLAKITSSQETAPIGICQQAQTAAPSWSEMSCAISCKGWYLTAHRGSAADDRSDSSTFAITHKDRGRTDNVDKRCWLFEREPDFPEGVCRIRIAGGADGQQGWFLTAHRFRESDRKSDSVTFAHVHRDRGSKCSDRQRDRALWRLEPVDGSEDGRHRICLVSSIDGQEGWYLNGELVLRNASSSFVVLQKVRSESKSKACVWHLDFGPSSSPGDLARYPPAAASASSACLRVSTSAPLAVPGAEFIVVKIEDGYTGEYCVLCRKWATRAHTTSSKHLQRVASPDYYIEFEGLTLPPAVISAKQEKEDRFISRRAGAFVLRRCYAKAAEAPKATTFRLLPSVATWILALPTVELSLHERVYPRELLLRSTLQARRQHP